MAKIFLPPSLIPVAPLPKTIPPPIGKPGAAGTFSLDDNQKRWLVVGICLHKMLLPSVRRFLKPEILKHYTYLKTTHNIDKQTYSTHLTKDGTSKLNYESINSNERNHRKNFKAYDYNVKSDVDLTKLYLQPFMAKFSALDDTCDLSAVLGILCSASVFSAVVQKLAKDVRQEIRNEWGHCNFSNWSEIKFGRSFQLMDSFLRALSLTPAHEKRLTDELGDWETKGMQLCLGTIVDSDLVKLIEHEVSALSRQVELLEVNHQDEAQRVANALKSVTDSIDEFKESINKAIKSLESSHEILNQRVNEISENTSEIAKDVQTLQVGQQQLRDDVSSTKAELTKRVDEVEENLGKRVEVLERAIENKSTMTISDTFQAPNRVPSFYGRTKELESLELPLKAERSSCIMSSISGLGGIGKTSLAIEHVWKTKECYKGGVFWLSGESVSHFQNSISEMARQVGTFDKDFNQMLSKTLHWLQVRKEFWCIVVDNLDEFGLKDSTEMMKLLCGHWKRSTAGHIIVTTRREIKQIQEDIPDLSSENCIELSSLSEQESVQFLKIRTGKPLDSDSDKTLQEISEELGYLPLALDQAAAYIKCTKIKFSQYLEQYKKQKLNTLKRYKAHYPAQDTSKERIAVHTTWQLNFDYVIRQSEDYGIGQAASLVMEVSAFLSADDIPLEIINEGLPQVEHEDLHDCLSSTVGVTDIISILTQFSLFQKFTDKSLSVHRLVQEVIRSKISKDHRMNVLQCASRMLHRAFANTNSPENICKGFEGDSVFIEENLPSLYLWGKLGAHADVLQSHLIDVCKNDDSLRRNLIYTEETAFLLNEASLYLSVCRQKIKAQDLQEIKLKILTRLEISEEKLSQLQYFDIPLKNVEFKLISHCMGHQEQLQSPESSVQEIEESLKRADEWREKGNSAYKCQEYQQAIDCYSVALKWFGNDCRSLCNRALCHLKKSEAEKALEDCESCLKIEKHNEKALLCKAWALYEMSKEQKHLCGRAIATAALAEYVDPITANGELFKTMFPNLSYIEIFNSAQLVAHFLYLQPDTTFLLHEGRYDLQGAILDKNVQFVKIDGHVTLKFGESVQLLQSHLYAEGICFPKGGETIYCRLGGSITMLKCQISSGARSCEDFPECNGGDGCIAALCPGRETCDRTGRFGLHYTPEEHSLTGEQGISGVAGFPAIAITDGGSGYFENCDIDGCGGGGLLCQGKGSKLYVKYCKVHNNHQAGLEAREGGRLEAIDNDIYSNGFHGIMIGPGAASCDIFQNRIYENSQEGIFVLMSLDAKVNIRKNGIYHNLSFGISLDRCVVQINHNDIFDNGFYGIHAKYLTTAAIENNDIYSNKCGGIHMGINYSGRVTIASNTVRDHSGPWLVKQNIDESYNRKHQVHESDPNLFLIEGETRIYSNPPIEKDNVIKNYKEGCFHPHSKMELIQNECAFCRDTKNLQKCSRCNITSYCSSSCQRNHWEKHKRLCSTLSENYLVNVELTSFAQEIQTLSKYKHHSRIFGSHLKGIGQGPKPDPKYKRRFIVKIQTQHLNCHPLQLLTLYDKSTSIDGQIQSPKIFHIIMECGVLGKMDEFTSKKAFFHATFVDRNPQKLKIDLTHLADYQDW